MTDTTVFIAADHRGVKLKTQCIAWLQAHNYTPADLGTDSEERCDAFDFAIRMAVEFKKKPDQFGILICGSGQAMAMTANRYENIRAALCFTPEMARTAREHNDANILVLASDYTPPDVALQCVEMFLTTKALGGRYAERRERLAELGGL
jgi:ribose 5-phosphate isomerase B